MRIEVVCSGLKEPVKSLIFFVACTSLPTHSFSAPRAVKEKFFDPCATRLALELAFPSGVHTTDRLGYPIFLDDNQADVLNGDLVSIPKPLFRNAMANLTLAESAYRRSVQTRNLPDHRSETHSWRDVMVQIMTVSWSEEDIVQRILAISIMGEHLIDDLGDNEGVEFLLHHSWHDHSVQEMLLGITHEDTRIKMATEHFLQIIEKFLPYFHSLRRALYIFGIRRMLAGGPIFSKKTPNQELPRLIETHRLAVIKALPTNSKLKTWIELKLIHPFSVALSIKPVYETIDAITPSPMHIEESFIKSIFLGGVVYVHNDQIERDSGETTDYRRISRARLVSDLRLMADLIEGRPPNSKRRILKNLPPIIEAFSHVLAKNGLLEFYLEFLTRPKIYPYLDQRLHIDAMIEKVSSLPSPTQGRRKF